MTKIPTAIARALALGAILWFGAATAQTFLPLKEPSCLTNPANLFTTGGQYVDPGNGVLLDSYSMLIRWQGPIAPVGYQLGEWTKFMVPSPVTSYQAGATPYNDLTDTPGAQIYCNQGGILLNTWSIPHTTINGGGYNTMYGYAWSSGTAPSAFRTSSGQEADLVLQINAAIPWVSAYHEGTAPELSQPESPLYGRRAPAFDTALFAYLRDVSNPQLHDIAIIGSIATTPRYSIPLNTGQADQLYTDEYFTKGFVNGDYANGVWFASGAIRLSSRYMTTLLNLLDEPRQAGRSRLMTYGYHNPNEASEFYRIHITPRNMREILAAIALNQCSSPPCPQGTYSQNLANYRVVYAGLIHELYTHDGKVGTPADPASWDQFSVAVRFHDFGVYQAFPANSIKSGVVLLTNDYYQRILGRSPEEGGRWYWEKTVDMSNMDTIVHSFRNMAYHMFVGWASAEYTGLNKTNAEFVNDLYQITLGRAGDPAGQAYWEGRLNSGTSRVDVVNGFIWSVEFYSRTAGFVSN
jgi:hypothetical protein